MIQVQGVHKSFRDNEVLKGVTFSLAPGEFVGLVGPSGGGKSVLLKILGSILEPDGGKISRQLEKGEVGRELHTGFSFQESALFDSLTVVENVAFPLLRESTESKQKEGMLSRIRQSSIRYRQAVEQAYEILCSVGLRDAYLKLPGQLSGGMRRRVGIARALVSKPELVLLDDPTGGLDPVAASVIIQLVKRLHQSYKPTVMLVSHDIRRLLPNVDRVLALFDGTISCDEPPHELTRKAPPHVLEFLATRYDFSAPASVL